MELQQDVAQQLPRSCLAARVLLYAGSPRQPCCSQELVCSRTCMTRCVSGACHCPHFACLPGLLSATGHAAKHSAGNGLCAQDTHHKSRQHCTTALEHHIIMAASCTEVYINALC